jgi:hypothetical protein
MKNLILFLILVLSYVCARAQFGPQQVITTDAKSAKTVFAADIDGDGAIDVLSASSSDDKIAWYRNTDGLGNFGSQNVIANLDQTRFVHAADLDMDNDIDVLAVTSAGDLVVWYENLDGQGTFGPEQIISAIADGAFSVIAADIDGDDDMDVISTSDFSGLAWYENIDGQGNFSSEIIISNTINNNRSVYAADLDDDNDLDLVTNASGSITLIWFENLDGLGNFGPQINVASTTTYPSTVFCADMDMDNDFDILTAIPAADIVAWHENLDGQGNFGSEQIITTLADGANTVFAVDLDNDLDNDVLSSSAIDSKIAWYINTDGQGSFGPQQIISTNAPGTLSVFGADLDNDTDIDVLSASQIDDKIAWYENLTILAVKENILAELSIYPNPVKNTLYVEIKENITFYRVQVIDALGKIVLTKKRNFNQLNLSKLISGVYFLKIETEGGTFAKKIVKE